MKKILSIFTLSLILFSCSNTAYEIKGNINYGNNGDSIALGYSIDGNDITITDKTIIEDGKFTFSGNVDGTKIYYIAYEDELTPTYSLFFLEPGTINADITEEYSRITGTPANDLNIRIEDTLAEYVNEIQKIQYQMYSDSLISDSILAELTLRGYELQNEALLYVKNAIRENTESIISIFLLIQYADLFDDIEFANLVENVPEEYRDRSNNCLYDILQEMRIEREKRDSEENEEELSFEDILNDAVDITNNEK